MDSCSTMMSATSLPSKKTTTASFVLGDLPNSVRYAVWVIVPVKL